MNKSIGLQLVIYSLLLAGLSCLVYHLAPTLARVTLITGLAGGVLCLVWGVWAMLGSRHKVWAILTLVPVSFMLLSQTVVGWSGGVSAVPGRGAAAAVTTLLLLLSLAMLMRIAYAGVLFGEPATDPRKDAGTLSLASGGLAARTHGDKRA